MTDREVMQQALEALEDERYVTKYTHIVDAINALRKALEQPEQGPSQWRDMVVVNLVREGINKHKARDLADHFATTPPAPQRPWIGLTDDEFLEACQLAERGNYLVAFQRIQAKLKERNT